MQTFIRSAPNGRRTAALASALWLANSGLAHAQQWGTDNWGEFSWGDLLPSVPLLGPAGVIALAVAVAGLGWWMARGAATRRNEPPH